MGLYRSSYTGSPVEAPLCPLEVYKLLLETIVAELARANAIRSNKWHVHHALSPYGPPTPPSSYRGPIGPKGGPLPEAWRIDGHPSCAEGAHGNCAHALC